MNHKIVCSLFVLVAASSATLRAQPLLVENGQPRAEIVIADQPARMARMAAHEFRETIEKISGARLPIVTTPSPAANGRQLVKVFIGASSHSPVNVDGLANGAYRMVSGADWLALIGDDRDFVPLEPYARNNSDIPRAQAEWEKIVGAPYGMPSPGLYKHRLRLPGDIGKPDGAVTPKTESFEIWGLDERGSYNAVCGLLHKLGARWYLPGELGEVLPSLKTIALPKLDETVRPDFALRQFNFRFGTVGVETARWAMRLGLRGDERLQIAHGMALMASRDAVYAQHPDWFALYGDRRQYTPGYSKNQLCYSNDELFRETVRWARALLDTYKFECVSIMPPDGYTAICQCEKCRGQDSPDRNERGLLSDHVWQFVNRVAKEIAKSHPNAKVLNCAYGVYTLPPRSIEKLEPNVLVAIVGGRRPINKGGAKGDGESAPDVLRAGWAKKTSHPLLIFENYPFTDRGFYLPAFAAHALGNSVNATKGLSQGEDIWLTIGPNFTKAGLGINHFLIYFTARMYWGGSEADVDALFREYCRLFYGPAEAEMLAFFNYCETNWAAMDEDKAKADEALSLFEKAKRKVGLADGATSPPELAIFAQRLATIDDFLKGLRMKSLQLAQKRGPVPVVRLVGDAKDVVIDGRLDDAYWQKCPLAATGQLRELQTGRAPLFGTKFKAGWQGNNLIFAIRCNESVAAKSLGGSASSRGVSRPRDTATRDDDPAIWHGDAIEIEIATETHSYYQLAISPNGHVVDLDRGAPRGQWFTWDSQAEVATQIADDHWTIEIRIPVTQDENDPLHQVVGRKPTQSLPWHINICRQRIREDGMEASALSPTGTDGFHDVMKFAHFYDGRSHKFDADATVTDFAIDFRAALNVRSSADALSAFLKLAGDTPATTANATAPPRKLTDYQKSIALAHAATAARHQKDFAQAEAIAARISLAAVKKTATMENLLAQQKAAEVVAQFGDEDIGKWPFWQRGEGFFARGRAFANTKASDKAAADFTAALDWTSEPRSRQAILLALGHLRETTMQDDAGALAAFRAVFADNKQIGGADEFQAVERTARILLRQGQHDDALATLQRARLDQLTGVWRNTLLLTLGDVHRAAGRMPEARAAWQSVLADPMAERRHQQAATERLKAQP